MKLLAPALFVVASFASKNLNLKSDGNDCKNVVLNVKDFKKKENLPSRFCSLKQMFSSCCTQSFEETNELPIEHEDMTKRKAQCVDLGDLIFKKHHLLCKLLNYLENADHIKVSNTCKYFKQSVLTLYKDSIQNYPTIHSFDRIMCLSALDFSFNKSFREEIAENQPRFFTQLHDHIKEKLQLKDDSENQLKDENPEPFEFEFKLCPGWDIELRRDELNLQLPEHAEYKKLEEKLHDAEIANMKVELTYKLQQQFSILPEKNTQGASEQNALESKKELQTIKRLFFVDD
jgi:hypothetical protein